MRQSGQAPVSVPGGAGDVNNITRRRSAYPFFLFLFPFNLIGSAVNTATTLSEVVAMSTRRLFDPDPADKRSKLHPEFPLFSHNNLVRLCFSLSLRQGGVTTSPPWMVARARYVASGMASLM